MWSNIIGHSRQIDQLKKALTSGRLAHAYMFSGPRGVGKMKVATEVAAAVACSSGVSAGSSCSECAGCRKVHGNNHPDISVVVPEESEQAAFRSIKIDSIRELQAKLQFHPMEASAKVAIIDDADRMLESAANSLLKTLEEPPAKTHIVLVTCRPNQMLPTIRSRCQSIEFQPLGEEAIVELMMSRRNLSATEARLIARLSEGSVGKAFGYDPDQIASMLERFSVFSKGASSADVFELAEEWKSADGKEQEAVFDVLAACHRDMLRYLITSEPSVLMGRNLSGLAEGLTVEDLEHRITEISKARAASETAANKQLMFEQLLFTLTNSGNR